jgi:ABC-type transport system substrate-binding protein
MNRKPIGAGPYMLSEWNQDGGMVLVRNPHYWNPDAQRLDKIVVKFIPDENSRYAALKSGDIDFAFGLMKQVQDARKNTALQVSKQRGRARLRCSSTLPRRRLTMCVSGALCLRDRPRRRAQSDLV